MTLDHILVGHAWFKYSTPLKNSKNSERYHAVAYDVDPICVLAGIISWSEVFKF